MDNDPIASPSNVLNLRVHLGKNIMTTPLQAGSILVVLPKLRQFIIERLVHNVCQLRSHMRHQ